MAYTYLIGWSKYNKFYYGVRFSKKSDPSELWVSYYTSSKHVKSFAKLNGDPDIIEIRKIFKEVNKARLWEEKVLRRMKVIEKDNWINKTNNRSIDLLYSTHFGEKNGMFGKKHSEQKKLLMSLAANGRKDSPETKRKKRIARIGSKNPAHKGFVKTPYGIFETLKEAAKFEKCGLSTMCIKVNNPQFINYERI